MHHVERSGALTAPQGPGTPREKLLNPLFQHHPSLEAHLPHLALGTYPSAIQRLGGLERACDASALYLKRDDAADPTYGGNKLRKLEYLLAEAKANGARKVMTFGAVGSNHALATAIHAKRLGLGAISMLVPQVLSSKVCRNLLAHHLAGAEMHHYPDEQALGDAVRYQLDRHERMDGIAPTVVPGGGTSALGAVGFVAAGFELANQVAAGELHAPARIYMAFGTTGTAAGLAVGLRAAGLDCEVVAVRVTAERFGNEKRMRTLIRQTSSLLHERSGGSFPTLGPQDCRVTVRHDCFGGEYARYTPPAIEAVRRTYESDGVVLEGTYTGKAMLALQKDLQDPRVAGQPSLFWNTYNSRPLAIDGIDYRQLPSVFHRYFEQPMQALDAQMEAVFGNR
ncbi:MAG: pyridoxal-phosphate dependent enzyme [Pseudomonadota bacterium]